MEWIDILKCPATGDSLKLVTEQDLNRINQLCKERKIWHIDGQPVNETIASALIAENGQFIYPIINGIVVLIGNLIMITEKNLAVVIEMDEDKSLVQKFYDEKGWFADTEGNYEDAVIFEDLRDVSKDYLDKCHNRVSRYLNPSGTYMLDAASGAIQFPQYLQYSAGYTYRVCVDFSFQALAEAKKKLGDKGIYIFADMTNLPFKDNMMDGFVSLNTIYHIPRDQQVTAVNELYRVLSPGGKGTIIYDWYKHSSWMNFWMLPFRGVVFIKNRTLSLISKLAGTKAPEKNLYFFAYNEKYFSTHLPPYKLVVWRSLSVHFMRFYIHSWLFGKEILEWVYQKEEDYPERCGRNGEYPMFVFEK